MEEWRNGGETGGGHRGGGQSVGPSEAKGGKDPVGDRGGASIRRDEY